MGQHLARRCRLDTLELFACRQHAVLTARLTRFSLLFCLTARLPLA